jgi:hypothetical protein
MLSLRERSPDVIAREMLKEQRAFLLAGVG